jgi:uncharacterized phage-associated protein
MIKSAIKFDKKKFEDVVHYVCNACKNNPDTLGKTKLHKILYFADMLHFIDTFEPLTGVEYQKQPFGPTARHLGWALNELEKTKKIKVSETSYFGLRKFDFLSLKEPKSNRISEDEKSLLDAVIAFVCGMTANEISDLSHQAPWEKAKIGEVIPYESAFLLLQPEEITQETIDWGRNEIARLGL